MRRADGCLPAVPRLAAVIAALLLAITPTLAARLPVRSYRVQEGLPRDHVTGLEVDPGGHLLIGTDGGLTRFDGTSFVTWSDEEGLPGTVYGISAEPSGVIWAGGESGLARLDPAHPSRFEPVPTLAGMPKQVVCLHRDRSGALWVGSSSGLHRIMNRGEELSLGPALPGIESEVDDIDQDADGSLWVGTHTELAHVDSVSGQVLEKISKALEAPDPHAQTVLVDRQGRLWAGLRDRLCLVTRDAAARGTHACARTYTAADGLPSPWINELLQDSDGTLIVATAAGLALGRTDAHGETAFRSLGQAQGITGGAAHTVAEDQDGNLWIGTADSGLLKLVAGGLAAYGPPEGLQGYSSKGFVEDAGGALYALGEGVGGWYLQRHDGEGFTSVKYRVPAHIHYLGWGWLQITLQDDSGRWWFPSGSGVMIYPAVARIEELAQSLPLRVLTRRDGLAGDEVFRLFKDSRGDVWISASAVSIWRKADGSLFTPAPVPGLPYQAVSAFAEDGEGAVWAGYYYGGLARFTGGRAEPLLHPEGLPTSFVSAMLFDQAGRLWVSTYQGLSRADHPMSRPLVFRHYSVRDGLPSRDVLCVVEDLDHKIWLGTSNGVLRLDPETGQTRRYTTADGLPANLINTAYRDRTGTLWFGTREGVASLAPGLEPAPRPPPILLESIEVAGEPRRMPPLGVTQLDGVRLAAGQDRLRIDYHSIDYRAGAPVAFQYRLDGSPEWSPPSSQRSVTFASLAPGRHQFEVRAVTVEGLTSAQPAVVAFTVEPPLWRTWWFMTLVAASVATAAVMLHRQRVARLLALERVRTRIATDLHDEVGAGLSEIALMGELWAREQPATAPGDGLPGRIAATSRRMVDSMSDIVWAINPEKDRVFSLSQRMRRFATTLLRSAGVALRFESIDESNTQALDGDARRELLLAFQEIVNNCVKHARCTLVEVKLRIDAADLILEVADNGGGFEPRSADEGTGLSSLRQRAARLGGGCLVDSQPGAGTRVIIRIPLQEHGRRSRPLPPPPPGQEPAA